jgi:hypothetical protein
MGLIAHERIVERERVINEAKWVSEGIGRKYFAQEILGMHLKNFSKVLAEKSKSSWRMTERISDGLERVRKGSVN